MPISSLCTLSRHFHFWVGLKNFKILKNQKFNFRGWGYRCISTRGTTLFLITIPLRWSPIPQTTLLMFCQLYKKSTAQTVTDTTKLYRTFSSSLRAYYMGKMRNFWNSDIFIFCVTSEPSIYETVNPRAKLYTTFCVWPIEIYEIASLKFSNSDIFDPIPT